MRQTCESCRYYIPIDGQPEGFCHREPPVAGINPEGRMTSMFAPVNVDMWCGEWWFDIRKWWKGFKWEPARTG